MTISFDRLKQTYGPEMQFEVASLGGIQQELAVSVPFKSKVAFPETLDEQEAFRTLDELVRSHLFRLMEGTPIQQYHKDALNHVDEVWTQEVETILIATGLQKVAVDELISRIKTKARIPA